MGLSVFMSITLCPPIIFLQFFKEVLKKYAKEEWFKDIICGVGCVGVQEIFDVIPTDITFEATGGTATVQVVVDDGVEWELTL